MTRHLSAVRPLVPTLSTLFPGTRLLGPEMPRAASLAWTDNTLVIRLGGGLSVHTGTEKRLGQCGELQPVGILAGEDDRRIILVIGPSSEHYHVLGSEDRGDPVERWYTCRVPRPQLPAWCDDGLGVGGRRSGPECEVTPEVHQAPDCLDWMWGVVVLPVPDEMLAPPPPREIAGLSGDDA